MEREEIQRLVDSFPRWNVQFDLDGVVTPIAEARSPLQTQHRKSYFFDPLVATFGGSLKGKRILDIGCNAGFWALQAIEAGCDRIVGVDGRQMHIDQANFVFRVKNVEPSRYQFICGNVFDLDFATLGEFDIVLCLGFFHHVSKQMQLLEKISAVNTDLLLLETRVSRLPGSFMMLLHESADWQMNSLDHALTMLPTKRAVFQMVRQFGYDAVNLVPQATHRAGYPDYRLGRRTAFFCAKQTALSRVPVPVERDGAGSPLKDIVALGAHWIMNRVSGR